MANLTSAQRKEIWSMFMQEASSVRDIIPVEKTDLRAYIDAVDDWFDTGFASLELASPSAGKNALVTQDKYKIWSMVTNKRWQEAK